MRLGPNQRTKRIESKSLISVHLCSFAAVFCLLLTPALPAQTRLTLQQAASRMAPDWTPVYDGKDVTVSGQISFRPLWASESLYLPIRTKPATACCWKEPSISSKI